MVSSESLGRGKGLVDGVVFNVVKVPRVVIAGFNPRSLTQFYSVDFSQSTVVVK